MGDKFMDFYWTTIVNHNAVFERVTKSVSERKWDHDWARAIAPLGNAATAKRFLAGRSGQEETHSTAAGNAIAGALQWLEMNAKNPGASNWRTGFDRQIGWFTMVDGIGEGLAYSDTKTYTRYSSMNLNNKTRERDSTNHGDFTTADNRNHIRDFVDSMDPVLFGMLRENSIGNEKEVRTAHLATIKAHLSSHYGVGPDFLKKLESLDACFENIDEIVKIVTGRLSDSEYLAKIKAHLSLKPGGGGH
jgi:hypothetical protein